MQSQPEQDNPFDAFNLGGYQGHDGAQIGVGLGNQFGHFTSLHHRRDSSEALSAQTFRCPIASREVGSQSEERSRPPAPENLDPNYASSSNSVHSRRRAVPNNMQSMQQQHPGNMHSQQQKQTWNSPLPIGSPVEFGNHISSQGFGGGGANINQHNNQPPSLIQRPPSNAKQPQFSNTGHDGHFQIPVSHHSSASPSPSSSPASFTPSSPFHQVLVKVSKVSAGITLDILVFASKDVLTQKQK
jgi:hypothetical protein